MDDTQTVGIALKDDGGTVFTQEGQFTLEVASGLEHHVFRSLLRMFQDFLNDPRVSIQVELTEEEYIELLKQRGVL
jgi:hypothetical protein